TAITGGTANFTANGTTDTLTLSGVGVLTGSGTLTVSGTTTWTNGSMTGTGQTVTNGALAITAAFQDLNARTLTVNGGATLSGSSILQGFNGAGLNGHSPFGIQAPPGLSLI